MSGRARLVALGLDRKGSKIFSRRGDIIQRIGIIVDAAKAAKVDKISTW